MSLVPSIETGPLIFIFTISPYTPGLYLRLAFETGIYSQNLLFKRIWHSSENGTKMFSKGMVSYLCYHSNNRKSAILEGNNATEI